MSPDVSIIIVSYNSATYIERCLRSIYELTHDVTYEIILVDNQSTDTTIQLVERNFPEVVIIKNQKNFGFAAANNKGIAASKGKFVLLLNPDTEFKSTLLNECSEYLQLHSNVGCVGPQILNSDGSLQRTGVSFPSLWNGFVEIFFLDNLFPNSKLFGRHRRLFDNPNDEQTVDYLQGSCLMIPKTLLEILGGMDDCFFLYFEETDLCYRLKQGGWRTVYFPQAKLLHYGGSGTDYYNEFRLKQYHKSFIYFITKHYPFPIQLAFRFVLFVRAVIRGSLFLLFSFRKNYFERGIAYFKTATLLLGLKK